MLCVLRHCQNFCVSKQRRGVMSCVFMTADLNVKRAFLDQLSVYSRLFLAGDLPLKKLTIPPQTAAKLCALDLFFSARTMNYEYIMETFF